MTWLTPLPAIIAACIAVPALIILYFLKLRRRDLEVSTTLLWKKAIQDLQANAPFQRLRRNILLLLQLLILAAVLFAIAQPQWRAASSPGSKVVLIIDRSASMATKDESNDASAKGPVLSRLDRAKQEALKTIDALRAPSFFGVADPDQAMIIAFDSVAEVVQPFTPDKVRLKNAVESIEETDALSRMDEALRLAGAYAKPVQVENRGLVITPGPPIELFSDGVLHDTDKLVLPPESKVTYHAVGKPKTANYAITAMRAERSYNTPGQVSIFVALQSTNPAAQSIDIELAVDGVVSSARAIEMPAAAEETGDSTSGVVFRLNQTQGAAITARIVTSDALAADNVGRIALAPAKRVAVCVVGESDVFLTDVLSSLPLSKLGRMSPAEFTATAESGTSGEYDIYVLSGWVPEAKPNRPPLPPGQYLVLGATPAFTGLQRLPTPDERRTCIIVDWDRRHPALNLVDLSKLIIPAPILIRAGDEISTLSEGSCGPMIVEASQDGARAVIVSFKPLETNWPRDVDFLLFLATAVRYLADDYSMSLAQTLVPGETLSTRLPAGASDAELLGPESLRIRLTPASDGSVSYGPLRRAGEYRVRGSGASGPTDELVSGSPQRTIPVNLFDPLESRLDSRPQLALPSGDVLAVNREGATGQAKPTGKATLSIWPWLVMAALAVLMLEWFIYHRKVHV